MARPKKGTVDYFPHYVHHGKTLYILENLYGNNGYAFFYKLLEVLADSEGHYYDSRDVTAWEFLQAKTGMDEVSTRSILDKLSSMAIIDPELWEIRVIWMDSFVHSIKDVYLNRRVSIPSKPMVTSFLHVETTPINGVSTGENPQSKVKESKVNKDIMSDADAIRLSDLLFSEILRQQPKSKLHAFDNGKRKDTVRRWAEDIEKLKRIDQRSVEDIEKVIIWVTADDFWKPNVLSGSKLREKWDTLVAQMDRNVSRDPIIQPQENPIDRYKRVNGI